MRVTDALVCGAPNTGTGQGDHWHGTPAIQNTRIANEMGVPREISRNAKIYRRSGAAGKSGTNVRSFAKGANSGPRRSGFSRAGLVLECEGLRTFSGND